MFCFVEESSTGVEATLSATIGIPEIAEVSVGVTTTLDITNSQSTE
jgi:hypothetical protein